MLLSALRNHRVLQRRNWRDTEQVKARPLTRGLKDDLCRSESCSDEFDLAPTRDGVMGEGEIRNRGHADQR
jgi:hypothetical protein